MLVSDLNERCTGQLEGPSVAEGLLSPGAAVMEWSADVGGAKLVEHHHGESAGLAVGLMKNGDVLHVF